MIFVASRPRTRPLTLTKELGVDGPRVTRSWELSAAVTVRGDADDEVRIGPRETELINLRKLLKGKAERFPGSGRVHIQHSGRPGDLRVHGMVMNEQGFSANVRFMEPATMAGGKLFSPILPLGDPISPLVVLANTNAKAATIHIDAYYSRQGALEEATLRTVSVPAGGAIHVDLKRDMSALPRDATNIGLTFAYYASGGILADVLLIDESGSGVYQVTPKGYASHGHASHSFPVRLGGDVNTIITLANPSETDDLTYSLNIFHSKGAYVHKETKLRPGEILNIDVKALRDQKIPGASGNPLPADFATGQAALHFRPPERKGMSAGQHTNHHPETGVIGIASATTFDTKRKTSFVDCAPQCPPEFYYGEVSENAYWLGAMEDGGFELELTTYDAGGSQVNPSGLDVIWDNDGYDVTDATGISVQLLQVGTAEAGGTVNAWGAYCYVSSCSCGDWIPFFTVAFFAAIVVPEPVNFHQVGNAVKLTAPGVNGWLSFVYRWESNTGKMQHLSNCQVGEFVDYPGSSDPYTWPPPWLSSAQSDNPTEGWRSAVLGSPSDGMVDFHKTGPAQAASTITQGDSFTAVQDYRWRCTYIDSNLPHVFQSQDIVRSIASNGNGGWKYTVEKSGADHGIDPLP
jgi:hypothetical protein